jgi:hypothetical protein
MVDLLYRDEDSVIAVVCKLQLTYIKKAHLPFFRFSPKYNDDFESSSNLPRRVSIFRNAGSFIRLNLTSSVWDFSIPNTSWRFLPGMEAEALSTTFHVLAVAMQLTSETDLPYSKAEKVGIFGLV